MRILDLLIISNFDNLKCALELKLKLNFSSVQIDTLN